MTAKSPYTLANRRDFVLKITRLSLWYSWRHSNGGDAIVEVLSSRTPIYRLTEFWDGVSHPSQADFPWASSPFGQITAQLQALCQDASTTAEHIEETGLQLLLPHLEPRMEKDIRAWPWLPSGYTPYSLPENQLSGIFACEHSRNSDFLDIHIANSCMPDSPVSGHASAGHRIAEPFGLGLRQAAGTAANRLQQLAEFVSSIPGVIPTRVGRGRSLRRPGRLRLQLVGAADGQRRTLPRTQRKPHAGAGCIPLCLQGWEVRHRAIEGASAKLPETSGTRNRISFVIWQHLVTECSHKKHQGYALFT